MLLSLAIQLVLLSQLSLYRCTVLTHEQATNAAASAACLSFSLTCCSSILRLSRRRSALFFIKVRYLKQTHNRSILELCSKCLETRGSCSSV